MQFSVKVYKTEKEKSRYDQFNKDLNKRSLIKKTMQKYLQFRCRET